MHPIAKIFLKEFEKILFLELYYEFIYGFYKPFYQSWRIVYANDFCKHLDFRYKTIII